MSATPVVAARASGPGPQRLAAITSGLLLLAALGFAIIAVLFVWVSVLLFAGATSTSISNWADTLDTVNAIEAIVLFASAFVFLVWLFRTVASVRRMGLGSITSPWLAVLWWFVPVAWFVLPYRVMRDLYALVVPDDSSFRGRLVQVWWAMWLASWALFALGWLLTTQTPTLGLAHIVAGEAFVYSLSLAAVAALSAKIVRSVSRGQRALVFRSSGPDAS